MEGALQVDWNAPKPSEGTAQRAAREVPLTFAAADDPAIAAVLIALRDSHIHGGAMLGCFHVGLDLRFDWFASRNRLTEFGVLPTLLFRKEISTALPELQIPLVAPMTLGDECFLQPSFGLSASSIFNLESQLAQVLFAGGAYSSRGEVTGVQAKQLASAFCEALFGTRYEDVLFYSGHTAWTPWFQGIAWDWTAVVFDKRGRLLWLFAVTDTD